MNRSAVNSTTIASIGYDRRRRELDIEFRQSGDVYRYFEVPWEEYKAFLDADSKGTYLNWTFKTRGYRYTLVRDGK